MNSLRRRSILSVCCAHRSGAIAIYEVLMILAVLFVLFELLSSINQALTAAVGNPAGARKVAARSVYGFSLDPDERHMWVHRSRENVVRINLAAGDVQQFLPTKGVLLSSVGHSRDASATLLCNWDGDLVLYCDGEETKTANVSPDAGFNACVADDGSVAVCVTQHGRVQGWRRHDSTMQEFAFDLAADFDAAQIGLNSTGRQLFVARRDGVVSFHAIETGKQSGAPLHVAAESVAFAWSRDESRFVVVTRDFQVQLYDVPTGRLIHRGWLDVPSYPSDGAVAKISPDGRRLAVSTLAQPEIYLWDLETWTPAGKLRGHEGIIRTLQFSQDSDRVFSGSYDGTIREWSLKTCSLLRIID